MCYYGHAAKMKSFLEVICMLSPGIYKVLKQVNVSKDAESTKVRVRQAWKSASNDQKEDILAKAGAGGFVRGCL